MIDHRAVELTISDAGLRRIRSERTLTEEECRGQKPEVVCFAKDRGFLATVYGASIVWDPARYSWITDSLNRVINVTVEYEERPSFISAEARADATVEHDLAAMPPVARQFMAYCPTCKGTLFSDDQTVGVTVADNWTKYYHPQCAPSQIPIPQSDAKGGNIIRSDKPEAGSDVQWTYPPLEVDLSAMWLEDTRVALSKKAERDAAILKECRAALAKLREWPRCKDHDAPMAVAAAVASWIEVKCPECDSNRRVAARFSEKVSAALEAGPWAAEEVL